MTNEIGSIGLASLNVCYGFSNSLWPVKERAAEFCRHLERADVDLVNFQEVWTPGLYGLLRRHLPSFPFVAVKSGTLGQPAGGLVSFSKEPLSAVGYVSFRGARPRAGGPLFRAKLTLGSCLKGLLTFEVSGRRTVVANVHLSANKDGNWSQGNRYEALQLMQLSRVHEALRAARGDDTQLMIASGDFNLPSDGALYDALLDTGAWRDPFAEADLPTFHAELLPTGARARRIDYLLVDGDPDRYPVTATELLFTQPVAMPSGGTAFLSDHMAQVARIAVPAQGS